MAESEHTPVSQELNNSISIRYTVTHAHTQRGVKDTRHCKRLSKGMESTAPGDLPGGDVNQDKMELQKQLTHLQTHTQRMR